MAMMVVLTVSAFGLFAYRAARASAVEAAHARLRSAIVQINAITELGGINQLETLRTVARERAVLDALTRADGVLTPDAVAALRPLQGSTPAAAASVVIELVGEDGATRGVIPADVNAPGPQSPILVTQAGAVGPLYWHDGALHFQSAVAAGSRAGGIRVTRRLGSGNANRRIALNLLGPDAVLLIGNQDGELWNGTEPVTYPGPINVAVNYERDGTTWLSAAREVKDTPWLYAVELPETVALAPARALIVPFVITGVAIALVGIVIGFRIGRHIAAPITDLTAATEAIARGDRDVALPTAGRDDEIGRLARAFGTMATSVRAVMTRLESEVDQRGGELTATIERLRRMDDELRQSEKFATLGRLSGSVGHELRNPLGVMSTVVVLIDGLPDASPKLKEYARLLREQIRLSERIITDVLDRARSGAPVQSVVDVPQLLDDIVSRAAVPAHIRVVRRDATPLPQVSLDRDHVGQIVWNLLTNAVQAIQGHAQRPGTITIGASVDAGRLRIEVHDTGPGISPAEADRVFDPTFTTKADGLGLGLSISRALAHAGGGELSVVATSGAGACFVLELPAA
jgi:signal transduction histidine kinase